MKRQGEKQVQISAELFAKLYQYFIDGETSETLHKEICHGLIGKFDSLYRHNLYTKSKTAGTRAERETARQFYLDEVGMREGFRWERPPEPPT